MEIEDKDEYSCAEVGAYLAMPPMRIGRIRNECCGEKDLASDGKGVNKKGLEKICNFLKREMNVIESGQPDIVTVQVIKQQCNNANVLFARDLERRKKCRVRVPKRDKARLNKAGTKLSVERVSLNANFSYTWTRKSQKGI